MKSVILPISFLLAAAPRIASAHPDHGTTDSHGPLHYLVDHPLLAISLAGLVIGTGVLIARRVSNRHQ